jgi:ABC-type dipeptide/oligopeptide/nickel transport system permease subunit
MGMKIGGYILIEASLSFLGLGAQPPMPTWGSMISAHRAYIASEPWMVFAPGFMIALTALCFNMLGDSLRDRYGLKIR